jgi:hypothetical protein
MLTSLTQAAQLQITVVAFSDGTLEDSLFRLRQFWLDINGRAKDDPVVWDVYGRKKAFQQDAKNTLLYTPERRCPALTKISPTLVAHVTYECSRCNSCRVASQLLEIRLMVTDIPPLPNSGNIKLQDLIEFGKWKKMEETQN